MIKYYEGSAFNAPAKAIVNTVNCVGVMGAGIALEFKLRYPEMFDDYSKKCKNKIIKVGAVDYYQNRDITIVNFPTKMHFKYPSRIEWIEAGLQNFVQTYMHYGITSIAFPKLGTLNGGLDWNRVKPMMEQYLSQIDAEVYICLDEKKEAEGLELEMVNYFNQNKNYIINNISRINQIQKETLLNCKPIVRFWHLSKMEKIGATTYGKIFIFCKEAVTSPLQSQLSLFD